MTYDHGSKVRATVRIRRDRPVKPEAEQIDGQAYTFIYGWMMDDDDSYPDEIAWLVSDDDYPKDAPVWIANGDLEIED
jgi:hypothetical protein